MAAPTSSPARESLEYEAAWLERNGWHKSIAGEEDFRKACLALKHYRKDRKNGLLIIGEPGCGKTFLAQKLFDNTKGSRDDEDMIDRRVWIDCSDSESINRLASPEDARRFNLVKPIGADEDWWRPIIFIDDLGKESPVRLYGGELNIIDIFIHRFHREWEKPYDGRVSGPPQFGNHLVITSNFSLPDLEARYGVRVMDRLLEMCAVVRFDGFSKRKVMRLE